MWTFVQNFIIMIKLLKFDNIFYVKKTYLRRTNHKKLQDLSKSIGKINKYLISITDEVYVNL